jgi:hypothetical protein
VVGNRRLAAVEWTLKVATAYFLQGSHEGEQAKPNRVGERSEDRGAGRCISLGHLVNLVRSAAIDVVDLDHDFYLTTY